MGSGLSSRNQIDVNKWDDSTEVEEHHGGEPQSGPVKEERGCRVHFQWHALFFITPTPVK